MKRSIHLLWQALVGVLHSLMSFHWQKKWFMLSPEKCQLIIPQDLNLHSKYFVHSKFCDSWCNWIMKNWNEYVAWRWIQSFFEVFFMLFFSFLLFKFFLVCRFYVSLFGFSVCFFLWTRSIKKLEVQCWPLCFGTSSPKCELLHCWCH